MRRILTNFVFTFLLVAFSMSLLKVHIMDFGQLSEEAMEEFMKFESEKDESENLYELELDFFHSPLDQQHLSSMFNHSVFHHAIAGTYAEPLISTIYSPPELKV